MNKIVFSFGRMNPPTKGHQKLINKVKQLAEGADHTIYLSHSHNHSHDPLSWEYKLQVCKKAFPDVNFCEDPEIRTPFQALEYLALALGYKDITMVVGSDRKEEFENSMTPYAEGWGVEKFCIVSAGNRDSKANGIPGISSARMRLYAYFDKERLFCKDLPNTIDSFTKKQIFRDVKASLR